MRILFICTHNRCRSVLAEAIANHYCKGLITAASAGSHPAGKIHPLTLQTLKEMGIPVRRLRSKSWDDVEDFDPDCVITVCDSASREQCPAWFGMAMRAHWNLQDPSDTPDAADRQAEAFRETAGIIRDRVQVLCRLLKTDPDRTAILDALKAMDVAGQPA